MNVLILLGILASNTLATECGLGANVQYGGNVKGQCGTSCCSQWGWCGESAEYCGAGCQSGFGSCGNVPPPTTVPVSKNGQCGPISGKCPTGQCCSQWGWCGTGTNYCTKCQPLFGDSCGGTTQPTTTVKITSSTSLPATSSSSLRTTTTRTVISTSAPPTSTAMPPIDPARKAVVISKCTKPGLFALTYDDGPSDKIPALLNKLSNLDVKATFFINAQNYANFVDPNSADAKLVKQIFDAGHQIGSHTFSHADMAKSNNQQRWDQMRKNDEAIQRIIGLRPTHLRPPFLATNVAMLNAMGSWGYKVVSINIDTKDYSFTDANALVNMMNLVKPAIDASIITRDSFISLNHDFVADIVQWTENFVNLVKAKGYKLVTTAECIGDPNPYR